MYLLKRKNPAKIILNDEVVETEILLSNCTNRNSIDAEYALGLGLKSVKPKVVKYKDGSCDITEMVEIELKVPVTNCEFRTIKVELEISKHLRSQKAMVKLGREAISKLLAYIDYRD